MSRDYTRDNNDGPARPAVSRRYSRTEELPYVLGEGTVRRLARELADAITEDARTVHGPVVWLTGNAYMPPMRSFPAAERVWQADNNRDGELFAFLVETVEDHLARENVYLGSPDYDNALYAVDLRRWQYADDNLLGERGLNETLDDEWKPVE